jgi:integrase
MTITDAAKRLWRGMRDGTIRSRDGLTFKPSVTRKYETALRLHALPRIGAVPVATLTHGDVQRPVDELAAEHTPEVGRRTLTALRVALRVAIRYGELDSNPCAAVRVPTSPDGERPARIIPPEEAAAILAAAQAEDARLGRSLSGPLIALAFGSGLRLGELLALRYGSDGLNLDAGIVHVRANLDRVRDESGSYPELAPKSRASRRDVPLAPEDVARLRRHRLATRRPEDGALVFANSEGKPLSPVPGYRAFKRACRAVLVAEPTTALERAQATGDPRAIEQAEKALEAARKAPLPRFHDVRHAFASHALAAGLPAHAVARLLGHSDAGLVWRRYGHALPDELASAGERLSAWRSTRA